MGRGDDAQKPAQSLSHRGALEKLQFSVSASERTRGLTLKQLKKDPETWVRMHKLGFSGGTSSKEPAGQRRRCKRRGCDPWVRKIPWRRAWQPTPVFLPGESHGQRSLAGYSPWGRKESDLTEAT